MSKKRWAERIADLRISNSTGLLELSDISRGLENRGLVDELGGINNGKATLSSNLPGLLLSFTIQLHYKNIINLEGIRLNPLSTKCTKLELATSFEAIFFHLLHFECTTVKVFLIALHGIFKSISLLHYHPVDHDIELASC